MKRVFLTLIVFLLIGGAVSCVKDNGGGRTEEGTETSILLAAPESDDSGTGSTRAVTDSSIEYLRIIIFEHATGQFRYNFYYDMNMVGNPVELTILTGVYDFVFIANEHNDTRLHAKLGSLGWSSRPTDIDNEYFTSAAIDNVNAIPMAGMVRNVSVEDSGVVKIGGVNQVAAGTWNLSEYIIRLAIRFDLEFKAKTAWFYNAFEKVEIANVPSKVYLFENRIDGTPLYNVTGPSDFEATARFVGVGNFTGNYTSFKFQRLILPSSSFLNKADNTKALKFTMKYYDAPSRGVVVGSNEPTNYTMPRNNYFTLVGNINDVDNIEFSHSLTNWIYIEVPM